MVGDDGDSQGGISASGSGNAPEWREATENNRPLPDLYGEGIERPSGLDRGRVRLNAMRQKNQIWRFKTGDRARWWRLNGRQEQIGKSQAGNDYPPGAGFMTLLWPIHLYLGGNRRDGFRVRVGKWNRITGLRLRVSRMFRVGMSGRMVWRRFASVVVILSQ